MTLNSQYVWFVDHTQLSSMMFMILWVKKFSDVDDICTAFQHHPCAGHAECVGAASFTGQARSKVFVRIVRNVYAVCAVTEQVMHRGKCTEGPARNATKSQAFFNALCRISDNVQGRLRCTDYQGGHLTQAGVMSA